MYEIISVIFLCALSSTRSGSSSRLLILVEREANRRLAIAAVFTRAHTDNVSMNGTRNAIVVLDISLGNCIFYIKIYQN